MTDLTGPQDRAAWQTFAVAFDYAALSGDASLLMLHARLDPMLDHDPEVCGNCFMRTLYGDVARDIIREIETGVADPKLPDTWNGTFPRWAKEVEKRWHDSKFVKLWVAEKEAGRDPAAAFAERGWAP